MNKSWAKILIVFLALGRLQPTSPLDPPLQMCAALAFFYTDRGVWVGLVGGKKEPGKRGCRRRRRSKWKAESAQQGP